jgi:hypothetical protein
MDDRMNELMNDTERLDDRPWWAYGYVWLLLAGPSAVIAAGAVTVLLAASDPDPVIDDYYRKGIEINQRLDAEANALAPAMKARNHAATGVVPSKP